MRRNERNEALRHYASRYTRVGVPGVSAGRSTHCTLILGGVADSKWSSLQNPCNPHECLRSGVNPDGQNSQIDIQWSLFSGSF